MPQHSAKTNVTCVFNIQLQHALIKRHVSQNLEVLLSVKYTLMFILQKVFSEAGATSFLNKLILDVK